MANEKHNGTDDVAQSLVAGGKEERQQIPEVTLKFGKGLVGEPFMSKSGRELVEVSIPNADPNDERSWETFVTSPKLIHENQYGKGVWMKLPEDGKTTLSRSVKNGIDDAGETIWGKETREISNRDLKSLVESYKEKNKESVLSELIQKKVQTVAKAKSVKEKTKAKAPKSKEAAR